MNSFTNQRRAAIRAIKRAVKPHFRDSGYVTKVDPKKPRHAEGNRRPVRLWAPEGREGVQLRGAFVLTEFVAITEFGPMTDAHGGGMIWESYGSFPVEDLLKLRAWAERTFAPSPT